MPEKLKNLFFTDAFVQQLADAIQADYPVFDRDRFLVRVQNDAWAGLELKQRMNHITLALGETLPKEYAQALGILRTVGPRFSGFDTTVFPDFVATYGLDDLERSMEALAFFTTLCSSEYGVRPFIAREPERAMAYLLAWADDENEHVRRLASEGCRPRVPWGMVLQGFRQDPRPILPILETLKDDPSKYVRTSVANNLNDISKDHPDVVLEVCERWYGHNHERDAIVKRACRGLLRQGNRRAMRLFGFGEPTDIDVVDLTMDTKALDIGDELRYEFDLDVRTQGPAKVRLELAVDYARARGKRSRKVFQVREATYEPGRHTLSRKLSFVDQSTRRHVPGEHRLAVIVNGVEKASATVELRSRAP